MSDTNAIDPHIVWWCATKHKDDEEWHLPGHGHTPEDAMMKAFGVVFLTSGLIEMRLIPSDALDTVPLNKEACLPCWLNREQAVGRLTDVQTIQMAVDAEPDPIVRKEMLQDYMRKKSLRAQTRRN